MNTEKKYLSDSDPILGKIIATIPTPGVHTTNNLFHDLMSCILEQQIHYRSTKKIFQKMLDKAELTLLTPDNFSLFEQKSFGAVKLSMNKYETILRILDYWNKNDTTWEMLSDDEIRVKLSDIKGVGAWTIDMILLYTFQRPDIFSCDDFHIKQIMTKLYGLNLHSKGKAQMMDIAKHWSPYKSTAFRYLLDWKSHLKG